VSSSVYNFISHFENSAGIWPKVGWSRIWKKGEILSGAGFRAKLQYAAVPDGQMNQLTGLLSVH